jgi:hypothetical protein
MIVLSLERPFLVNVVPEIRVHVKRTGQDDTILTGLGVAGLDLSAAGNRAIEQVRHVPVSVLQDSTLARQETEL